MSDNIEGLVKLTVNLIPEAFDALNASAERDGDTRTDVVNRALQFYCHVVGEMAKRGIPELRIGNRIITPSGALKR